MKIKAMLTFFSACFVGAITAGALPFLPLPISRRRSKPLPSFSRLAKAKRESLSLLSSHPSSLPPPRPKEEKTKKWILLSLPPFKTLATTNFFPSLSPQNHLFDFFFKGKSSLRVASLCLTAQTPFLHFEIRHPPPLFNSPRGHKEKEGRISLLPSSPIIFFPTLCVSFHAYYPYQGQGEIRKSSLMSAGHN